MKYLLTLMLFLPLVGIGQDTNCIIPNCHTHKPLIIKKWTCGNLKCTICYPNTVKLTGDKPVYGPQGSLIGVFNGRLFIKTDIRNHLIGKPLDKQMLENDTLLINYLKLNYNL